MYLCHCPYSQFIIQPAFTYHHTHTFTNTQIHKETHVYKRVTFLSLDFFFPCTKILTPSYCSTNVPVSGTPAAVNGLSHTFYSHTHFSIEYQIFFYIYLFSIMSMWQAWYIYIMVFLPNKTTCTKQRTWQRPHWCEGECSCGRKDCLIFIPFGQWVASVRIRFGELPNFKSACSKNVVL